MDRGCAPLTGILDDWRHCLVTLDGEGWAEPRLTELDPWTCGFRKPDESHEGHDQLAAPIALAARFAATLDGVMCSTETELPYCPFVLGLPADWGKPRKKLFRGALAAHPEATLSVDRITRGDVFIQEHFEDDLDVYFSEREVVAYRATTALMRDTMGTVWEAHFAETDVVYPQFWFGAADPRTLVGVFSVRVET